MHSQVLRELADVIARLVSIIFERSWWLGEPPEDWKKANATPVFENGKKEVPVNYSPVSFTSKAAKFKEQLMLEMIFKQMKYKKVIMSSHHAFTDT